MGWLTVSVSGRPALSLALVAYAGESSRMDPFFSQLGRTALDRWGACNFKYADFPRIARELLEEMPPCDFVDVDALIQDFLLSDEQPEQGHSPFGQPELIVFEHPRLYVQLLFWMDGTTDIHQHMFSGAFHVLQGSSMHSQFAFDDRKVVSPHLHLGRLRHLNSELLETGQTREIVSGMDFIHSLFHLDTPSITVVLRTQSDPESSPQFTYLPPAIALDPLAGDALTGRRKQLLDILEQGGDPSYPDLIGEMLQRTDFERGFFILQNCSGALRAEGAWENALDLFRSTHGVLVDGIEETIDEITRRDRLVSYRGELEDPEHRFFLAILLNAPSAEIALKLVADRFECSPLETVSRWLEELSDSNEEEVRVLDVLLQAEPGGSAQEALARFLADVSQILRNPQTSGTGADVRGKLSKSDRELLLLRQERAQSSLAVLVR